MDRKALEHEMKYIFGCCVESYNKELFYKDCRKEAAWNLKLCTEERFMKEDSFRDWIRSMDWIEIKYDLYLNEHRYFRTDISVEMSDLYAPAQKIYNWGKDHTWAK